MDRTFRKQPFYGKFIGLDQLSPGRIVFLQANNQMFDR